MDIETKLQRFSDVVRKEAENARNQQFSEITQRYGAKVSEFEKRTKRKYEEMTEEAVIAAENLKQKNISHKKAEIKKALIQERATYIDLIFNNVSKKLDDFFETPEYEQLIVDRINDYKEAGDDVCAYIMRKDEKLLRSVMQKTGITVLTVDEDFLGGVRISLGKNRTADCTFRHRFDTERARFNKIKIL